jgi:hypothetical protein
VPDIVAIGSPSFIRWYVVSEKGQPHHPIG